MRKIKFRVWDKQASEYVLRGNHNFVYSGYGGNILNRQ